MGLNWDDQLRWEQRDNLKLKVGDKAYYLYDESYGIFDVVTITGECEEGRGYEAYSPRWAAEKSESDGIIHTCNSTLLKTKREARAETIRILHNYRKEMVEQQGRACRSIQYIDYVLSKKGRHP